jgi:uncharacterized protein (DUF4415 family)
LTSCQENYRNYETGRISVQAQIAVRILVLRDLTRPHVLNMRIDRDVLNFFRKTGKGYQSRINAILRAYVERRKHKHHQEG